MSTVIDIFEKCERCQGVGIHTDRGTGNQLDTNENPCIACNGKGFIKSGILDVTALKSQLDSIVTKIDAIKAMLDSQTIGLQKMSSNLDDIMVKLDV